MKNFKKIFFTMFIAFISIMTVNAKERILTCEYYKTADEAPQASVLCEVFDDYSHQCYMSVGSLSATKDSNEEKIQNWGAAVGLTWQAEKYVKDKNMCPNYLVLKMNSGFNGYEIHAAENYESALELVSYLNGERYLASLSNMNIIYVKKQNAIKEIISYIEGIKILKDTYSSNNCTNLRTTEKCQNIIFQFEAEVLNWNSSINNYINLGYFTEEDNVIQNYRNSVKEVEDFFKEKEIENENKEDENNSSNSNNENENNSSSNTKIDVGNFCNESRILKAFRFIGYLFFVVKILVPILLIIFGTIDFSKAVIASNNDEIQKSTKALVTRILAGIFIFFIPTIVNFAFSLVRNADTSYGNCRVCLFEPLKCEINE